MEGRARQWGEYANAAASQFLSPLMIGANCYEWHRRAVGEAAGRVERVKSSGICESIPIPIQLGEMTKAEGCGDLRLDSTPHSAHISNPTSNIVVEINIRVRLTAR